LCFEHSLIVPARKGGVLSVPYRRVSFDVAGVAPREAQGTTGGETLAANEALWRAPLAQRMKMP
jgi:hypothetical protein